MTTGNGHVPELLRQRQRITTLLNPGSPADAVTAYYALYHDPRRTHLAVHSAASGRAVGFVAVCQTGLDLFRPLAVVRAGSAAILGALLQEAMTPKRPYFVIAPADAQEWLAAAVSLSDPEHFRIYTLVQAAFQPVINIHVRQEPTPDGAPHWVIRLAEGGPAAVAGVNWRSPQWAEVYVHVDPRARGRGLGRSVVSACSAWLLEQHLQPLYLVAEGNAESIALAESLGYRDTRARHVVGQIQISG